MQMTAVNAGIDEQSGVIGRIQFESRFGKAIVPLIIWTVPINIKIFGEVEEL